MYIDRKLLKREARLALRDHKPNIYLTALVYVLITLVLEILSTKLQYPGLTFAEIVDVYYDPVSGEDLLVSAVLQRNFFSRILSVAVSVMTTVITFGFASVCLSVSRKISAGIGDMFDVFGFFLKALWLQIIMNVFTVLWSLLFVVPGIIAAYRYSMAPFILIDDPDKSVMQCIRESKELTSGYKWQLFVLELSLIGWTILSMIPLVRFCTLPYLVVTKANFYNKLCGYVQVFPEGEGSDAGNDSFGQ